MTRKWSAIGQSAEELGALDTQLARIQMAAYQTRQILYQWIVFGVSGTARDERLAELLTVIRHAVDRLPAATRPSDGRTE